MPEDGLVVFSAHGVPKSGAGRGAPAPAAVRRRHLPAGLQGPSRGRAPPQGGPHRAADRPCRPSRGDRHHGPGGAGLGAAGRDRGRCRGGRRARPGAARLLDPDHAVGRRHRRRSSPCCGAASRRSRGRATRTSATPPPTASAPWPRSRRAPTCSWSWVPPTRPTRCGWSRSPASTAAGRAELIRDRRRHRLGLARRRRDARPLRRRLGARAAGRGGGRRLPRAVRGHGRGGARRRGERDLPLAADPAAAPGLLSRVAVYTDVAAADARARFLADYELGRAGRARGHRRGGGELQLPPRRPSAAASS